MRLESISTNSSNGDIAMLEFEGHDTNALLSVEFTPHRICQLESVYVRVFLIQEVSWEIDDCLQTATKTFYSPFTKVDREEDYRRAWAEFEKRYGEKE
jgi:hypothetical protein